MWSSWTEKATKGFTEALEKTGEAISQAEKKASKGFTEAFEKTGEAITQVATKAKPRTMQRRGGRNYEYLSISSLHSLRRASASF